jgi:hypothetical protein
MKTLLFQARFELLDIPLVRHCRKWKRLRAGRVGGVRPGIAMDRENLFGTTIIGLKLLVGDRPGRRNAFFMFQV